MHAFPVGCLINSRQILQLLATVTLVEILYFYPTHRQKESSDVKRKPHVSLAILCQMAQACPTFLILQNICVVSSNFHGTPAGWVMEGRPVGMRCLAWPGSGLQVLGKGGQWERLLGTSLTSYRWPKPTASSPSSSAPGHQKEMYLIFKSLLEPKRIPAKQP